MAKELGSHTPSSVQLTYQLLRNTTSPDETAEGVKSFVANLSAFEILKLDTGRNLRTYIPEYNPKRRSRVHEAIRNTIQTDPHRFITRNSGFTIAASGADVDDNNKVIRLTDPSIINGAQSQGEIQLWVQETYEGNGDLEKEEPPFYVRAEIIVDPDWGEVVETAIARNTATPVKSVSQAGAQGVLDDLEASITQRHPDFKIQKKETDAGFDPRKILQYARLLMPVSVSKNDTPAEKLRAYKNPEQCLSDFADWHKQKEVDPDARAKYEFTVKIAPYAVDEYQYWERHEAWSGQHIWEETKKGGRACRRDKKTGKIVWVSPGLIFPILGAMSEFVEQKAGNWVISKPTFFEPDKVITQAVAQFRNVRSDPMQMGRSPGAYDALRIYPATLVTVMRDIKKEKAKL
jgi:hypothetical protein